MSLQETPDRITKRNIEGETAEEPRIVGGVLETTREGDINIHVRGYNPYSYKGRTITQQIDGHAHFGQQILPQVKVIFMV
jgi:hypothetical protein